MSSPRTKQAMMLVLALLLACGLSSAGLKWAPARFAAEPAGAPVFSASSIYVMGEDGRLNIYEFIRGTPQRPYDLGAPTHVAPLAAGNLLVVGTDDGHVTALNREQMQQMWDYPASKTAAGRSGGRTTGGLGGPSGGAEDGGAAGAAGGSDDGQPPNETLELRSLAFGGGSVYAVYSNKTVALDASTGRVQKVWTLGDAGAAAADSSRLYVMDGGTLKAFSAAGGGGWTLQTGALYQTSLAVDENAGRLYAATTKGYAMSISTDTGVVAWQYPLNGWPMATPLPSGDEVVVGANDGRLRALDRDSGALRWSADLGAPIMGGMAEVARGSARIVLVPTQAPSLAAVDSSDGAVLWDYPLSDWPSSPAISSDGRFVAVATRDHQLYVITLSPMCTIDSPRSHQLIAPFTELDGRAWAWEGVNSVALSVQGRRQEIVLNRSGPFRTMLDLTSLREGSVDIRCLAEGRDGSSEVDNGPSKSSPILSLTAAQAQMSVTAPYAAEPGGPVTVYVRNAAAYDMSDVQVDFNGQQQTLSSPVVLRAPAAEGAYNITVSKPGFAPVSGVVRVQADRRLLIAGGIVGAMAVCALVYFTLTRRRKVEAPTDYSKAPGQG